MRYENGIIYVTRGSERDIRILNNFVKGKYSIQQMEEKINVLKNEMDLRFDSDYSKPTELYDAICLISKDASVKKVIRESVDRFVNPVAIPTEISFGRVKCSRNIGPLFVEVPMEYEDMTCFFEQLKNVNKGYLTANSALQALRIYCEATDAEDDEFLQDKWDLVKMIDYIFNTLEQDKFTIHTDDFVAFDVHAWATVDAI